MAVKKIKGKRVFIKKEDSIKQQQLDPRQQLFLANFLDPKSKTFSNVYKSAKVAGFGNEYCKSLSSVMPKWLSDNIIYSRITKQAEKNVLKFTSDEYDNDKIKADMTKFSLERLKRKVWAGKGDTSKQDGLISVEVNIRNLVEKGSDPRVVLSKESIEGEEVAG